MFYHLLYPMSDQFTFLNVFQYITFRAAGSAITALIISFLIAPFLIRQLRQSQIVEQTNNRGPISHKSKDGTPTMLSLIHI